MLCLPPRRVLSSIIFFISISLRHPNYLASFSLKETKLIDTSTKQKHESDDFSNSPVNSMELAQKRLKLSAYEAKSRHPWTMLSTFNY